jgi:hypothetical protein
MESTSLKKPDKLTDETAKIKVKTKIVWQNVVAWLLLHLLGLYGLYISIVSAKLLTWIYGTLKEIFRKSIHVFILLTYLLTYSMVQDIFQKLIVIQLVKQQPAFFMKPEASLPCSQKPATRPYP